MNAPYARARRSKSPNVLLHRSARRFRHLFQVLPYLSRRNFVESKKLSLFMESCFKTARLAATTRTRPKVRRQSSRLLKEVRSASTGCSAERKTLNYLNPPPFALNRVEGLRREFSHSVTKQGFFA